jgi:type III pantothenate kinase
MRMRNGYANPQQLGADRWISAVGALAMGLLSSGEAGASRHLIVSAGTATTVDLIGLESLGPSGCLEARFLGGWIWPGLPLMAQSLRSGTRDLQYELDAQVLGRQLQPPTDSRTAISAGVALAQAAPLIRLMDEIKPETMLLHGGAADFLGDALAQLDATIRPVRSNDLSLRGLQAVLV